MHFSHIRSVLYRCHFRPKVVQHSKSMMTTSKKMQEALEDLKSNPYFDKYSGKITKLKQEAPEKFKTKVIEMVDTKEAAAPKDQRNYSQLLNPKKSVVAVPKDTPDKSLNDIMKVDLIKDKSAEEIKEIWLKYHVGKDFLSAAIPAGDFERLRAKGKEYPTFLFPLPRSQGFEFIMCQFERNVVHFTPLLYYQVHKENAPECLTLVHYTEFQEDKQIVLMRGEYDKNIIDAKEAQCLVNQLQMYYSQNDPDKSKLLETFTKKPDKFDHQELIRQIENISLS